jgi:hypothetical protein
MSNKLALLALAATIAAPVVVPAPALAQQSYGDRDGRYDRDNRDARYDDREYRGNDRRYRRRCSGGNGAVGTVAGGAGGALAGSALGGGTLGTIAGGVGGALLGRTLDKKNTRSKNGC